MSQSVSAPKKHRRSNYIGFVLVLASLISVGLALWKFQDIHDFIRLYGYEVPGRVEMVASKATMTDTGRKLFYVNRPEILGSQAFAGKCPIGAEKTVVLGCYKSNDNGIYLFNVTDPRLDGVVEVTAAHEMLHAAYMRLSDIERKRIDTLLTDYYEVSLQDQRIKDTIEAYKQTEPTELVNEMHSIFGTEVAGLPPELEEYYARYFTNRKAVVGLLNKYQAEFVSRQSKIESYDAQLKRLKVKIDASQTTVDDLGRQIESQQRLMNSLKSSDQITAYNNAVDPFNALVNRYNNEIYSLRASIAQYNDTVEQRNAVAVEQEQLTKSLSTDNLPQTR